MTKKEMCPFWYSSPIILLVFYFLNTLSRIKNVEWRNDVIVGIQIKEYLDSFNDSDIVCHKFCMDLQKKMFVRN